MPHSTATAWFSVIVCGEAVRIPERTYFHPETYRRAGLSQLQCDMIDCLHTRNHDGFVRERALRSIAQLSAPWTIPFVVRLVGEYVIEILDAIYERRNELDPDAFREFLRNNPLFGAKTRSRVTSYWNAYYRRGHPVRADYVGSKLLVLLDLAHSSKAPRGIG
jgi:hypothetical protein